MKKLFSTKYSANAFALATFIMRLGFGGLIIHYGYGKLLHFAERSHSFSDPLHIGHTASLSLVIFAEFFCGILVLIGFLTRLACIPLIITMSVVVFYVNHGQVFGNKENAALYLAGFIAILFIGPGKISLDKLIGK
jgi:putative oxidoreductase